MLDTKKIKTARIMKDLKSLDVARLVGVTPITYSNWEAGRFIPNDENMVKLCDVLGLEKEDILLNKGE